MSTILESRLRDPAMLPISCPAYVPPCRSFSRQLQLASPFPPSRNADVLLPP